MRALLIAAALALTGCATTGTVNTPVGAVSLATADEKAMIALEGSYHAVLVAVNAAVDSGLLRGEKAQRASVLLSQANGAVRTARAAYDAGNAVQSAARAAEAVSAMSGLRALLGK